MPDSNLGSGGVDTVVHAASREDLIDAWRRTYGSPPPSGSSRQLLELSAAWSIQAKASGGLSARTRRRLRKAAGDGNSATAAEHVDPALQPGARLARNWRGRAHIVDVTDDGFIYDGRPYRSLSAIARAITGAHWSGPRFFGLAGQDGQA